MKYKRYFKSTILLVAILFAIALLFYLRMMPTIGHKVQLIYDKAFNYRMTAEVIKNGRVPEIDRLSTYPDGKNIKALLPTGMYYLSAYFFKFINLCAVLLNSINNSIKPVTLTNSIFIFTALCGALIFIPVYFLAKEIYPRKIIAYLTAFLAGIMPAYLHRSTCYWYRFETVATPVLFASLLFFIKAFKGDDAKKSYLYSSLSAAFLVFSFCIWRLSILFLFAYALTFLYAIITARNLPKEKYITFLIAVGLPILFFLLRHESKGDVFFYNYLSFPKATLQLFLNDIGIKQHFSDFTKLVSDNIELKRVPLSRMFDVPFFSFSGIFAFIFFISYFENLIRKTRDASKDIIFVFLSFFLLLTFLFLRLKIILAPIVALTMGESLVLAFRQKKILRYAALVFIAIILIGTLHSSYLLASTRYQYAKMDRDLDGALRGINKSTPRNAVILSYWADGYFIQTYCNRPTLTDGLLESHENAKRILAVSKIYYSQDDTKLRDFCRARGATYILIPENRKRSYAIYAGVKYGDYFNRDNKPTSRGRSTVLYKLIYEPGAISWLKSVYENKTYRLYKIEYES